MSKRFYGIVAATGGVALLLSVLFGDQAAPHEAPVQEPQNKIQVFSAVRARAVALPVPQQNYIHQQSEVPTVVPAVALQAQPPKPTEVVRLPEVVRATYDLDSHIIDSPAEVSECLFVYDLAEKVRDWSDSDIAWAVVKLQDEKLLSKEGVGQLLAALERYAYHQESSRIQYPKYNSSSFVDLVGADCSMIPLISLL